MRCGRHDPAGGGRARFGARCGTVRRPLTPIFAAAEVIRTRRRAAPPAPGRAGTPRRRVVSRRTSASGAGRWSRRRTGSDAAATWPDVATLLVPSLPHFLARTLAAHDLLRPRAVPSASLDHVVGREALSAPAASRVVAARGAIGLHGARGPPPGWRPARPTLVASTPCSFACRGLADTGSFAGIARGTHPTPREPLPCLSAFPGIPRFCPTDLCSWGGPLVPSREVRCPGHVE